jgi:hypothetical protein
VNAEALRVGAVIQRSAGRISVRVESPEEHGMTLQPLHNVQWSGVSAAEQDRIAAALFGCDRWRYSRSRVVPRESRQSLRGEPRVNPRPYRRLELRIDLR